MKQMKVAHETAALKVTLENVSKAYSIILWVLSGPIYWAMMLDIRY